MRQYGYLSEANEKRLTFVPLSTTMNQRASKEGNVSEFEYHQLKRRILELEQQLRESEMKSIAWQTMIDLAEQELNISIKKKYNTKPFKR